MLLWLTRALVQRRNENTGVCMIKKLLVTAALAAASFTVAAPAQADPTLTNGEFETHDFTGWTGTGNTGFTGVQCPGPGATVNIGNCSAFFGPVGSTGGISQNVTGLTGGQSYNLSFWLLLDGGSPGSVDVMFDGNSLLSVLNPPANSPGQLYSFLVTPTGSAADLTFLFRDDPGFDYLDSVNIAAVPEPSTWAMMLLSFAGLGFVAYRRQRRR